MLGELFKAQLQAAAGEFAKNRIAEQNEHASRRHFNQENACGWRMGSIQGSLCVFGVYVFSFIWIGGKFPVDNFRSDGRILTCNYDCLICILWICYMFTLCFFIFIFYIFVSFTWHVSS